MARKMKIRAWDNGKSTYKKTGKKIPGHYITEVNCEHNGKNILTCLWGPGVSKNPFLAFNFKGAKKGDSVKISWVDNQGGKGKVVQKQRYHKNIFPLFSLKKGALSAPFLLPVEMLFFRESKLKPLYAKSTIYLWRYKYQPM